MDNTLRSGPQFARDHKQTYYYTIYIIIIIICSETEAYAIIISIIIIVRLKLCMYRRWERLTTVAKYQFNAY